MGKKLEEQKQHQKFIETNNTDGKWLSPITTERIWQEEQLVKIFGHYPNASPRWQYMNGLIQNSLKMDEMYSKEEVLKLINKFTDWSGSYVYKDKLIEMYEQLKKK
jgi:hypothetical protein